MFYSLEDLQSHLSAERFAQGQQLFANGQVTAPNVQHGEKLVTAIIPKYPGRPLRVYVRIQDNSGQFEILGECTCSRNRNCEHVAAVLLQALAEQQALPAGFLKFSKLDALTKQKAAKQTHAKQNNLHTKQLIRPSIENQQRLLYFLETNTRLNNGTLVETRAARVLKKGGYNHKVRFNPVRATRGTPPSFLQPVDIEILTLLLAMEQSDWDKLPILSGPKSAQALKTMLATERCFAAGGAYDHPPLTQGDPRTITFNWHINQFGTQYLEWQIEPHKGTLLPLSQPWYLDKEANQLGPLETHLPSELISELVALSPVTAEQASRQQQKLQQRYPNADFPSLHLLKVKHLKSAKPIPCLYLTNESSAEEIDLEMESLDFALLSFDYGGINIARSDPPLKYDGEKLLQVHRSNTAENSAIKQLNKLDFELDAGSTGANGEDCFFLSDDANEWLDFQRLSVPKLRQQGWRIDYSDSFRYRLATAQNWYCKAKALDKQDWFHIGLGVEIDGERVNLLPVLVQLLEDYPHGLPEDLDSNEEFFLPLEDGRWLAIPLLRLRPIYATLLELYSAGTVNNHNIRLSRFQIAQLTGFDDDSDDSEWRWLGDQDVHQLTKRLRNIDGVPAVSPPNGLHANLRSYQQRGLDWLQFLREYQLAGILADDMGLGKTVQALAHLLLEKEQGRMDRPSLVIAPTSLMFNWQLEAKRFTPELKVLILQGPQRHRSFDAIAKHDIILTTYPLLTRDEKSLLAHDYHMLILDEAQVVKNPKAKASKIIRKFTARHRLCLTGTPMENHLGELWSLFDFLLPGLLGQQKQFRRFFRTPIESQNDKSASDRLAQRIRPFLLRRTKSAVAKELPPKTEIIRNVVFEDEQRELYESIRLATFQRVRDEIQRQGIARSQIVILDALLKLRQVCCDPRLVKMESAKKVTQSAKLKLLMQLLTEMIEEGRKILLFSQFTGMLSLIEDEIKTVNISYVKLTGKTRDRATPVKKFQQGDVSLFLVSLKAGGVGLNLTAADVVIHYDPWWNPAVERQATDRAHRIGQQQPVFVYKLISEGTVEEKIQAMQARKQALADSVYGHKEAQEPQWTDQDLQQLFAPMGT